MPERLSCTFAPIAPSPSCTPRLRSISVRVSQRMTKKSIAYGIIAAPVSRGLSENMKTSAKKKVTGTLVKLSTPIPTIMRTAPGR